ncbi:MAG: hypothetical protein KY476_20850 [Planctomycetes bacterium]|nr:hypothetical protein [Planctomycetota bacterium]
MPDEIERPEAFPSPPEGPEPLQPFDERFGIRPLDEGPPPFPPACGTDVDCPLPHNSAATHPGYGPAAPAELAFDLEAAAADLVFDIEADYFRTCDYRHLLRDARHVYRAASEVRRSLRSRAPDDRLAAGLGDVEDTLKHLESALGPRRSVFIDRSLREAWTLADVLRRQTGRAGDDVARSHEPLPPPRTRALPGRPDVGREDRGPVEPVAPPRSLERDSEPPIPENMKGLAALPPADRAAALRQRTCPVTGDLLGSMGRPLKVDVRGRSVFVCCRGCVEDIEANPAQYLPQLNGK